MTKDKADYTGQINAKKLGPTGITETIIGRHHRAETGNLVVVASISVSAISKNVQDGTGTVNYVIDDLEVAPEIAVDHIRNLISQFNYERRLETQGPTLLDADGTAKPRTEEVVAAGQKFEPHPYLASTLSTDDTENGPVCDVCGQLETAAVHADRTALVDPFATSADAVDEPGDQDGDTAPVDDPAYEPHGFHGGPGYACGICDQPEDSAVHQEPAVAAT